MGQWDEPVYYKHRKIATTDIMHGVAWKNSLDDEDQKPDMEWCLMEMLQDSCQCTLNLLLC